MTRKQIPSQQLSLYSFITLVIVFVVGSAFPQSRVWGINHFAYWFDYSAIVIGTAIILISILVIGIKGQEPTAGPSSSNTHFVVIGASITVLFAILFYLCRGQTHFLGDGTQLIPILISENTAIKPNNVGEQWLHIQLYKILAGDQNTRALMSYQFISIGSGILSVVAVLVSSYFLFRNNLDRFLFSMGVLSGGYLLMFFGYVENYSLLVFLIILFFLLGIIGHDKLRIKIILIPIVGLAVWMHTFGLLLVPSLVYLFVHKTTAYEKYWKATKKVKYLISGSLVVALVVTVHLVAQQDAVLRFSLLPVLNDRFTVEGYSLFSRKHIFDLLNLIIMTAPFLLVVMHLIIKGKLRTGFSNPKSVFLLLSSVMFFLVSFVFDPKLSMPVDWDIFCLFVIPLTITIYYVVLHSNITGKTQTTLLMVLAGFMVLIPRVLGQTNERVAIAHAFNYCDLDTKRNTKTFRAIEDYVDAKGLRIEYGSRLQLVDFYYPEFRMNESGLNFRRNGRFVEAIKYYNKAINANPQFGAAYYNMAFCYNQLGKLDSALYYGNIAYGLNPVSILVLNELAVINFKSRKYQLALEYSQKSLALDPDQIKPLMAMATIYSEQHEKEKYVEVIDRITEHSEAPLSYLIKSGDFYFNNNERKKAKRAYQKALSRDPDSPTREYIKTRFPDL